VAGCQMTELILPDGWRRKVQPLGSLAAHVASGCGLPIISAMFWVCACVSVVSQIQKLAAM
jgi:hypothetical protein